MVQESHASLEDFRRANYAPIEVDGDIPIVLTLSVLWMAPLLGLYKINWDATIDIKNARIGVGIIAHDSQGWVVAARSLTLSTHANSLVAEA